MSLFRLLILVSISALSIPGFAQSHDYDGMGTEVNFFAGRVIKHTKKFMLPIPPLTTGADVNLIWKTNGKKAWQQRRHYPTVGLGFTYTDYGIDAVYGRCFSVYPNITFPIVAGNRVEWTMRIGDGAGFVTRHYSRFAPVDTLNNAIGSHINDYATLNTDIRFQINTHWDVQAGLNLSHISNASFQQPNLGINLAGAHLGLRYFPGTSRPAKIKRDLKPLRNNWGMAVHAGLALDQPPPAQGPSYPVYLASALVTKKWISKNKFFAGIDYSYHESVYAFLRNNNIYGGEEARHSWKSAIFGGNEFLLGRVGVVLQLGVYIKQTALDLGPFYEKLGANLYLIHHENGPVKDLFLCGYLKAHREVAELAEFGFGMGF